MAIIKNEEYFMQIALEEAEKALETGDIPVGAVIVFDDKIVGKGHNQIEKKNNSLLHAEMLAIKEAIKNIGYKHLLDCTLYVTLEPCAMCAGAIVLSRIKKVIYAAADLKTGAGGSIFNILQDSRLNHRVEVESGLLESESSYLIKNFFVNLRKDKQ